MNNIILSTDSYKFTHWKQYPPKTEYVYSYFESRGSDMCDYTIFFGLQYFLKKYLVGSVFNLESIKEAKQIIESHIGNVFNESGWTRLLDKHRGSLPISIKAIPEGTVSKNGTVLMTVENTDPEFFWLTNYIETLLVQVWYPSTVATLSNLIKKTIVKFLEETGDPNLIDFKLHDFGFRGVSSPESAAIGGLAHLVNFKGTDTVAALVAARDFYSCPMAGFSIPAAEHSTITSWGKENESKAMSNMLQQFSEFPLVAVVSDSYDVYKACSVYWGSELKENVLNFKGTLVIRPDSGDPMTVVLKVLEILGDRFGYETNSKGFKVLNPKVRVIQGDGVDKDSILFILTAMKAKGWSADNIAFGMGGGLLQKLNRDTQKFAFKCSAVKINGEWNDVYKSPVTQPGKNSKSGRFDNTDLVEVFRNGSLLKDYTLEEVRQRCK